MAKQPKKVLLEPDKSHDTEPMSTPSDEQHAALGSRKMNKPAHSGYTTEEPENKLVAVPTSPQSDSSLPNIITGDAVVEDTPSPQPEAREIPAYNGPYGRGETVPEVRDVKTNIPTGAIWWLGGGLILANAIVGGSFQPIIKKVWSKPEAQGPQAKTNTSQAFELAGTILFLIILATIARINPGMTRPIVVFLIGVWMVWLVFTIPTIQKEGIQTMFGQLFGQNTTPTSSSSGTPQKSALGHGKSPPPSGGSYELGYRGVTNTRTYSNFIGV